MITAAEAKKLALRDLSDEDRYYAQKIREAALRGHVGAHFHCKQDEYATVEKKFKSLGYETSEWWSHGPMGSSDWSGIFVRWG